jgi:hypothetical protein
MQDSHIQRGSLAAPLLKAPQRFVPRHHDWHGKKD